MEPQLHKVTGSEMRILHLWLKQHLPDSIKLYETVTVTIEGKWHGTSFYTLGWPNILAAAEGVISTEESACALYHSDPRTTSVYSPNPDHLETLLLWPGFYDWSRPIYFQGISHKMLPTIEKISANNGGHLKVNENVMMQAQNGRVITWPVQDGFEIRHLDPDQDADFIASNWSERRRHTLGFVRELLRRFPCIGVFDGEGKCIGVATTYEFGAIGMVQVREEYRGRGFGKAIVSHLAEKHLLAGRPAFVWVMKWNNVSLSLHEAVGFKAGGDFDFAAHHFGTWEEHSKLYGHPPFYVQETQ